MNEQVEIENYLLGEMEDEQRDELENRVFADDDYFFELCDTENALVDRYAAGTLKETEVARFETAAKSSPNLAVGAANARVLREFIRSERISKTTAAGDPISFWSRVRALFAFAPVPSFGIGSAFLIVVAVSGFLLVENGRRNAEIARLESELSNSRSSGREAELENELSDAKARESELQGQIDEERDISGDLASDLAKERENRRRLEKDVSILKKSAAPETARQGEETVSVLRLQGNSSTDGDVPQLNAEGGTERVSLLISIPGTVPAGGRVSIRLNGVELARNIAIRQSGPTGRQVNAAIGRDRLAAGQNVVTVHDATGKELSSYQIQGGPVR